MAGPGDATRDILVALPPHYDEHPRTRYRVIYLQDGQNCFDPTTSYAGHWSSARDDGAHPRHPVILVGIPNLGHGRLREYSPFDDVVRGAGEGAEYLRYLVRTVKPLVDAPSAPTGSRVDRHRRLLDGWPPRAHALIREARTFSAAWVLSPALWYAGGAIYDWIATQPGPVGQLWLDTGVEEGDDQLDEVRQMRDLLVHAAGDSNQALHYHEDPDGDHDEASWGRRVDEQWRRLVGMLE